MIARIGVSQGRATLNNDEDEVRIRSALLAKDLECRAGHPLMLQR